VEVTAGLEECPLDVRAQLVEHWQAGIEGAHAQRGLIVFAYKSASEGNRCAAVTVSEQLRYALAALRPRR
jgi:hypothetical protein